MVCSHRGLFVIGGVHRALTIRPLLTSVAIVGALMLHHPGAHAQANDQGAGGASSEEPPPPPPPPGTDNAEEPPSSGEGGAAPQAGEVVPLQPGEAVVTRFSNTTEQQDGTGKSQT